MGNAVGKTWEPLAKQATIGPIDPEFRPLLVDGVSFVRDGSSITAIKLIDRPAGESGGVDPNLVATNVVLTLNDQQREDLKRIFECFNGSRTVAQVVADAGARGDDHVKLIQYLFEQAVVRDATSRPVPPISFYRHIVNLGRRQMLRQLDASPMAQHMVRGTLTKRLVVGYLVEEYHLVASAASHISPLITATNNERLRMMFCDYLSGEYWHCLLLKKGLLAAGITEDELAAADPLASTLGIINLQRNMARTDLLAYSACLSINEGGDVRAAAAFDAMYNLLTTFVSPEALAPSREHAVLDFEDEHETLGAEPYVEELALGASRQHEIYRAVMARVHTQAEQHREMAAFYGAPEGPLVHSYYPGRSLRWGQA